MANRSSKIIAKKNKASKAPKKIKSSHIEQDGIVEESVGDNKFRVKLVDNGHEVLAYTSGKVNLNYIKILPGDKVKLDLSMYDLSKGRITFRYKNYESESIKKEQDNK